MLEEAFIFPFLIMICSQFFILSAKSDVFKAAP